MRQLISPLLFLLFFLILGCKGPQATLDQQQEEILYRVAFYNVENLFDLENDPRTNDDEFTPKGRNEWTQERYQKKLDNISKVISGMRLPGVIGLCEVENGTVLADLAKNDALKAADYKFVHFDSPDFRGIDVALMYKSADFKVLASDHIQIDFPKNIVEDYTTRDILYVKTLFMKRDTLHFFVNHWPSRRGGVAESEPKRLYVAQQLRKAVDRVLKGNPAAQIIIMGDLNDETANNSVVQALKATGDKNDKTLYDCFVPFDQEKLGSYNFRGNWNMLDHIIVSPALLKANNRLSFKEAYIYKQSWMMYVDKKYGERPNRTYGGPRYFGGYSDHLPVYIDLKVGK